MQKAANFVAKYSTANKSKAVVPYDLIKATEKWVEYSLDIVDMNRILMQSDFDTKWRLMEALDVAERKRSGVYPRRARQSGRCATGGRGQVGSVSEQHGGSTAKHADPQVGAGR